MVLDKEGSLLRINSKVRKWGGHVTTATTDYANGTAILSIRKNNKDYKFLHKAKNAKEALSILSWSVCRLIDCDIRGILPFEKTAKEYLALSGPTNQNEIIEVEEKWFVVLGLTSQASNDEILKKFKQFARDFHPDTFLDESLKLDAQKRFSQLTEAYNEIKKGRKF